MSKPNAFTLLETIISVVLVMFVASVLLQSISFNLNLSDKKSRNDGYNTLSLIPQNAPSNTHYTQKDLVNPIAKNELLKTNNDTSYHYVEQEVEVIDVMGSKIRILKKGFDEGNNAYFYTLSVVP